MTKITIELPDNVTFTSREQEATFDFGKVKVDLKEFVVAAMVTGITKAGIDSASGAAKYAAEHEMTVEEATQVLMDKWIATRYETGWARASGEGLTAVQRKMVSLVREAVKAQDEKWYKSATEPERFARCREYLGTLKQNQYDGLEAHATQVIERAKEEREKLGGLLGGIEV